MVFFIEVLLRRCVEESKRRASQDVPPSSSVFALRRAAAVPLSSRARRESETETRVQCGVVVSHENALALRSATNARSSTSNATRPNPLVEVAPRRKDLRAVGRGERQHRNDRHGAERRGPWRDSIARSVTRATSAPGIAGVGRRFLRGWVVAVTVFHPQRFSLSFG
jgi:hypothetical protein